MLISGVVLCPLALGLEQVHVDADFGMAVGAMSLLAILGRGAGVVMFYILVRRRGPLYASMAAYMIPIVALSWSWMDDELITRGQLVAIAGVLTTVSIVQRNIDRLARAEEALEDTLQIQ